MEADKTTDARSGCALPATMIVDHWNRPETTETVVSLQDALESPFKWHVRQGCLSGIEGASAAPAGLIAAARMAKPHAVRELMRKLVRISSLDPHRCSARNRDQHSLCAGRPADGSG